MQFFPQKNNLYFGLGLGLIVPFVAFAMFLSTYDLLEKWGMVDISGLVENFRQRTCAILAICVNILLVNIYNNRSSNATLRGIIFATFIYVFLWVIYFGLSIMNQEKDIF